MNLLRKNLLAALDVCMAPLMVPAAALMRLFRRAGADRLPLCRQVLGRIGVFPVANHYYEPLIDFQLLRHPLHQHRSLPGIDLNVHAQLELLKQFRYSSELQKFSTVRSSELTYAFDNGFFDAGDAEFWYNLIRLRKPRRIIEIGSGNSTLLAIEAIRANHREDPSCLCEHTCIEPYEMPWLERSGVLLRRQRVEDVDPALFKTLQANDILFIDSSHVIRPQGDVLCEFLQILPALNPGVIVHVHDIFTPRDYPQNWVVDKVRMWNEQYLMEALLSGSRSWKILALVNYLRHDHFNALQAACPFLTTHHNPASCYLVKTE